MLTGSSYAHVIILWVSLVLLVLAIWAVVVTIRDHRLSRGMKVSWTLVLLLIPVLGLVIWGIFRLAGRSDRKRLDRAAD